MDLVSIIIPIYNVSEYVDKCITSVCSQTYSELEIILIDDGSTDDCYEKCNLWAKKDSRIKVVHKENGGLSDARNAGLDVATGKYIYFLDGDDYIETSLVETVLNGFLDDVDMVSFWYNRVEQRSNVLVSYQEPGIFDLSESDNKCNYIIQYLLKGKAFWEAWNRMYVREIIEKNHLRFADNRLIFAEDLYFLMCYFSHIRKINNLPASLYNYVCRSDSIMSTEKKKLNTNRYIKLANAVYDYYLQHTESAPLLDIFPLIYFWLLNKDLDEFSLSQIYEHIKNEVDDKKFAKKQMKKVYKSKGLLYDQYIGRLPLAIVEERINHLQYCFGKNKVLYWLKNKLIYKFWKKFDLKAPVIKQIKNEYRRCIRENKEKRLIYLIGSECFGNVGDYQISESILSFIDAIGTAYKLKEITMIEYPLHKFVLPFFIKNNDIIFMTGGGNVGDEYIAAHNIRKDIITRWPFNKKIVFPQTIDFSKTQKGCTALEECEQLFTKENNMFLFAREQYSYEFAKKHFSCNVYLVPDIVLSKSLVKNDSRDEQILLCFRSDVEKVFSDYQREQLEEFLQKLEITIAYTDLQLSFSNDDKIKRKQIIETSIRPWRQSKLVITDRLHGMVFAAVTGTPCIAFSNYNHKVKGTYEWIKHLKYIKYVETVEEAIRYIPELLEMNDCVYDNAPLQPYFEILEKVITENAQN